jgi:DNA-binding transcriptional LysR family regulator
LPHALDEIQSTMPNYRINLRHDLSRNIQIAIQQGKIDLGIVVNAIPSPDLVIKKVATDDVCVWQGRERKNNKVFCNLDLIQTQVILRKWKDKPNELIHTDSLELIVRFTRQGLGFGIIPTRVVELQGAKLNLISQSPIYKDTISVVYRPEFGKNPVERFFVEAVKRSLS